VALLADLDSDPPVAKGKPNPKARLCVLERAARTATRAGGVIATLRPPKPVGAAIAMLEAPPGRLNVCASGGWIEPGVRLLPPVKEHSTRRQHGDRDEPESAFESATPCGGRAQRERADAVA
jgi:hypothetical protein